MALYEISDHRLSKLKSTSYSKEKILERKDLQAMFKENIEALMPDTMVLAEEYGDWEESESLRRIDLLCLGRDAQIIVVELKRTDSGGHSDLQAIRYAAMVSKMTFSQAIKALAEERNISEKEAEKKILKFFGMAGPTGFLCQGN